MTYYLKNEAATQELAQQLAAYCQAPLLLYLSGELGSGKTTLVRALLRALGVSGPIKSPTYSLVEPYHVDGTDIFHFDLYRLACPDELELIGWRDYLAQDALWLVEWPEKAQDALPRADLTCRLSVVEQGRRLEIEACSEKGDRIVLDLTKGSSI